MKSGEIAIHKGRGAVSAPVGRFESRRSDPFDDGWDSPPPIEIPITEIRHDAAKSVLTTNESPDIPHGLSLNPYRGCEHGCVYCFARPSHAYLGLSPGIDFETKIYAKTDAVEILRAELRKPGHRVRPIALGINTDSYQPVERKLKITRAILELLAECRHPVSLITKSALIERDLDILSEMAKSNLVEAAISITSLDNDLTRKLEPRAAAPARRLRTIENLARAGVPVGVMMAPIIPAVTDREIESLLAAAKAAGAGGAGYVVLRLPHELREVFFDWLDAHLPLRAKKVRAQLRDLHGGRDYDAAFFKRQKGQGILAQIIAQRFRKARARLGLDLPRGSLDCSRFVPPSAAGQARLL